MEDCVGFQAQIASIMEVLANSAVLEICRLVEDGFSSLRAQMQQERLQSDQEKDVLRTRLREMDGKVRSYERRMRRRNQRDEGQFRAQTGPDNHQPLVTSLPAAADDEPFHHMSKDEGKVFPLVKQEKDERDDCNLDLKVELNIRAECGISTGLESSDDPSHSDIVLDSSLVPAPSQPSPPEATVDLTCRPRAKRKASKPQGGAPTGSSVGVSAPESAGRNVPGGLKDVPCGLKDVPGGLKDVQGGLKDVQGGLKGGAVKPEVQADDGPQDEAHGSQLSAAADEPSPERLGGLGLDLAWMQERVSHLGAAYAVAQLGLGNSEPGHPSASFGSQGGDGLDGPPTMLFTAGGHEMAAFAASFDMAAAAVAVAAPPPPPPAPPPPAAPPAPPAGQRRPYRAGAPAAKDPAVCAACGRVFPSGAALELHQRVHAGDRPYTCPHCGKGFAQPNNLRVHLLIHTGERRYRCTLCGKSFISSSHLKRHRTVHTQEKPYSCSRCGQSFSQMCSVRRHRQQSQCGL